MKKLLYTTFGLWLLLCQGCKEEGRLDHIDPNAPAPEQVYDVQVKNIPGGAVLKYKLPKDDNLLYVKAEYEIQPGVIRKSKASYYSDSLLLDGYGNTGTFHVNIYSVGRNEKTSAPLSQTINPLTPPVISAFGDLKLTSGFGGITVMFKNKDEANLAIVLMNDSANTGEWVPLQTFYTKAPVGSFSFRGLKNEDRKYAVYLRDRWNNRSDTIVESLTPLYEEFIPKTKFQQVSLPTDSNEPTEGNQGYLLSSAWDGITDNRNKMFASTQSSPMPQWFTFDMGVTAVVSRLKVHHRAKASNGAIQAYTGANVKKFELYGSNHPNPDGSWDDSWIPLGKFEAFKPSGASATVTPEDHQYANVEGIDFDLVIDGFAPNPFVPVRYIRFKTTETYNGPSTTGSIWIAELSVWGQIQK